MKAKVPAQHFILTALLASAFLVRLGVRIELGEEYFWTNGYAVYYKLAESVVSGNRFCLDTLCARRPPLYPLLLTLSAVGEKNYLLAIVPQALIGAGTAFCAFLIGRRIFSTTVGLLACAITAFYPYYVMHDTALQETGLVTFCTALSVWLLLRASNQNRNRDWLLAGLALGSIALVRASVAPTAALALLWTAIWGAQGNVWERVRKSLILLFAVMIIAGPWLIRNYYLIGAAVLSSETGHALWVGNNSETFSHYPAESIDRSEDEAWSKLSQSDRIALTQLEDNEIATSNWFKQRAWAYIRENPWPVIGGALRKVEAGFSPWLNPMHDPLSQATYAIAYVPVAILGITGMFLARRRQEFILIGMLFLLFICVTAVFWAHTSHRSYLDVYWIVFTAATIESFRSRKGIVYGNSKSAEGAM